MITSAIEQTTPRNGWTRTGARMAQPTLKSLPVEMIHLDSETQSRAEVSWATVEEYSELWMASAEFPPLDVFRDRNGCYYLADGFHRLLAAKRVRKANVICRVRDGSVRDAFLFACTANQTHGLRRTNADKRHMVTRFLADNEWVKWTDSRIADQCGVSHTFVAALRKEYESVANSAAAKARHQPRTGADGKTYPSERKSRIRQTFSKGRKGHVAEGETEQVDDKRTMALKLLKNLGAALKALGVFHDHATALDNIERDVRQH